MSHRNPVLIVAALVCTVVAAGCGASGDSPPMHFAKAIGPHIKPLAIACPKAPLKSAVGYINTPVQVSQLWNGDWLVADGGNFNSTGSKVVMFSPTGTPIWAVTGGSMNFVHSAYMTTRGNVLISDTNNNRVIEVDPATCEIVFNTDDLGPGHGYLGRGRFSDGSQLLYPNDASELPNGHYLISSRMNSTIFEIDRHGHVFWKCHSFLNLQGKPDHLNKQHNPQRLPNGDTLISDSDNARVIIVNPSCTRMVWEYTGHPPYGHQWIEWPRDAVQLRDGDILIDDSIHNRCLEVNWNHTVVREYYDLPEPYSCIPLKNGLVASGNTNTHGIVLWSPGSPQANPVAFIPSKPIANPLFKPPSHLVNGGFETPESPCINSAETCGVANEPPAGAIYGWQEDDLLTESLPPQPGGAHRNFAYDSSVSHQGYSSGRISWTRNTPHAPLFWGQVVKVFPYRRYTLSYWMKTQNVQYCASCDFGKGSTPGNSAYIAGQLIRPSPFANPNVPSYPKISGTTNWTKYSETFFVPQGVRYLNIQCLLTGKGTVWFDDVVLHMTAWRLLPGT